MLSYNWFFFNFNIILSVISLIYTKGLFLLVYLYKNFIIELILSIKLLVKIICYRIFFFQHNSLNVYQKKNIMIKKFISKIHHNLPFLKKIHRYLPNFCRKMSISFIFWIIRGELQENINSQHRRRKVILLITILSRFFIYFIINYLFIYQIFLLI